MDPYEVLGAHISESVAAIKSRYLELARKHHPDKAKVDDNSKFQEIQNAWEILADESRRKAHDDQVRMQNIVLETAVQVDLDDLPFDNGFFKHLCTRCADSIHISEDQLDKGLTIFECNSCSSRIHLIYQVELI